VLSVAKIQTAKNYVKTRKNAGVEWIKLFLGDRVGKLTQHSDLIVALNKTESR